MFVCSVGDEVATQEEQIRAKNDRLALIAKYRQLQTEFNNCVASKRVDVDKLTEELQKMADDRSKEMLDLTCTHTMQMTQLQSALNADIDLYYTKSKGLEAELEKKQTLIQMLTDKVSLLEDAVHSPQQQDSSNPATENEYTDTGSSSPSHFEPLSFPDGSSNTNPTLFPPNLTSASIKVDHPQSLPDQMYNGLSLSSVQRWNENLRIELQRVHFEQEAGTARMESLKSALAQSELERGLTEQMNEELREQLEEVVRSKEKVLAVVDEVKKKNEDLKKSQRRMKHL